MFNEKINEALNQKLPHDAIRQRRQGGMMLNYVEGYYVIDKANQIFGFGGWSYEIVSLDKVAEYTNKNNNAVVGYQCVLKVTIGGVVRMDVGNGKGISSDLSDAHEGASKEAVTDALKRALRTFGNVFGLALYDKDKKGVAPTEADIKQSKNQIMNIVKDSLCGASQIVEKRCYDYIKANGVDISNNPIDALNNVDKLKQIIEQFKSEESNNE